MFEKTNYEGTYPKSPDLDYYNLYHSLKHKIVGLQLANDRLASLCKEQSARLDRVLTAYALLEDKLGEQRNEHSDGAED